MAVTGQANDDCSDKVEPETINFKCEDLPDDLPDTESESSSEVTAIVHPPGLACYKPDEWLPTEAIDSFEIETLLAYGAYGEVYLVVDRRSNRKMAIKKMQRNRPANTVGFMTSDQIDFEVDVTKRLDHINLIRCHNVFSKGNNVCMVWFC